MIQEACAAPINKYGVGSCGPRGFYGTIDVHLDLEKALAEFMGTEETIIYAYDLATVPSVLPAFANAKDIIIYDEVRKKSSCHYLIVVYHSITAFLLARALTHLGTRSCLQHFAACNSIGHAVQCNTVCP